MIRNKSSKGAASTRKLIKLLKTEVDSQIGYRIPNLKKSLLSGFDKLDEVTKADESLDLLPVSKALDHLPEWLKEHANSNILKLKYNAPLSKLDFELLLPSSHERKYETDLTSLIKDVVIGRDPRTLRKINSYYVFFDSPAHAAVYVLETMNSRLSSAPIRFEYAKMEKDIKFLYPPIIADIETSKYMDNSLLENTFKSEILKQLYRNETESALVTIARQMWHDIKYQYIYNGNSIPEATRNTKEDNQIRFLKKVAQIPHISRSNVVILYGIDKTKTRKDIGDEFWEFTLYPIEDIAIRKVMTDESDETNTWLVIFASSKDAKRCAKMYKRFALDGSSSKLLASSAEILN